MTKLSLPMAGYSPTIADFDNDGWKDIFVTRGHVQSLLVAAEPHGRAAQHRLPQSGWNEVFSFDRGSGTNRAAPFAASWLGRWRLEWRWPPRCSGKRDQCSRGDLDQPESGKQSLDRVQAARHQEQSRRHRRENQGGHEIWCAVQPHVHERRVCVVERGPGSFRVRSKCDSGAG